MRGTTNGFGKPISMGASSRWPLETHFHGSFRFRWPPETHFLGSFRFRWPPETHFQAELWSPTQYFLSRAPGEIVFHGLSFGITRTLSAELQDLGQKALLNHSCTTLFLYLQKLWRIGAFSVWFRRPCPDLTAIQGLRSEPPMVFIAYPTSCANHRRSSMTFLGWSLPARSSTTFMQNPPKREEAVQINV